MIQIHINKAAAHLHAPPELLTAGMQKAVTVQFVFSPDWDGLTKTAVFTNGRTTVDVLAANWDGDMVTVPHEVLAVAGRHVRVGVYGTNADGVALPTIWAELGKVRPGADPSGDTSTDESLPVWAQLQEIIGDLDDLTTKAKNNLVAAINEAAKTGSGGAGSIDLRATDDYIQYSTDGGATWQNLIALADLKGDKGDPGEDYTLTDADKTEIAAEAAALVDVSGKQEKITAAGILKGDGAGGVAAAVPGEDYLAESNIVICNITGSGSSYTSDMRPSDIVAARAAGKIVVAVHNNIAYQLIGANAMIALFLTLSAPTAAQQFTINQSGAAQIAKTDLQPKNLASNFDAPNNSTYPTTKAVQDLADELKNASVPAPASAAVGQIVKVKAVDAEGKITQTEAVDLPTGMRWQTVRHFTLEEDTRVLTIDKDENGVSISEYNAAAIQVGFRIPADATQASSNGAPWVYPAVLSVPGINEFRAILNVAGWKTTARQITEIFFGDESGITALGNAASQMFPVAGVDYSGYQIMGGVTVYINASGDHLPAGTICTVTVLSGRE